MTTTTTPPAPAVAGAPPRPSARRLRLVIGSTRHRLLVLGSWLVVALLVLAATGLEPYRLGQLSGAVVIATAIVGLNVVTGYTGLLSVGHSALLGVGAYTTGVLVVQLNLLPLITVPAAVLTGALVGAFVGLPSIRIRGLYLAMVTLALAVAFPEVLRALPEVTGGNSGLSIPLRFLAPPAWTGLTLADRPLWTFLLCLSALLVSMLLVWCVLRSRLGRDMRAVRDHEAAAESFGVHVARTKILAFTISGGITGLAGAMLAMYVGALSPAGSFTILKAIELLSGLVLGGVATQLGPLVGAAVVVYLPVLLADVVQGQGSGVLFGALLIVIVFVMPEGVVGRLNKLWRQRVDVVPRGMPAPVADPP
ncbi:branched-chain amino acid ABC transporter permease [Modestobacter sp. I12A-02628]|uniref:Branched-chain amino acid ABC transporter permease n=1 Tax=Goekera deserti TaxID=2497753 RepID=A0A7K3WG57_9ACTN|nr:branched-chain amino acid ABC transporter permease [Goekera deserti]MPQ96499.1 branched-chain amino acid ABC transporter permease [Goekera deserti]NDI47186.1 branched-chain amino acid ABC transporter permease [Goekera deserti]NEL55414.1 branched-chain amino acid ABC transporter permease [Goekera deserti]